MTNCSPIWPAGQLWLETQDRTVGLGWEHRRDGIALFAESVCQQCGGNVTPKALTKAQMAVPASITSTNAARRLTFILRPVDAERL